MSDTARRLIDAFEKGKQFRVEPLNGAQFKAILDEIASYQLYKKTVEE